MANIQFNPVYIIVDYDRKSVMHADSDTELQEILERMSKKRGGEQLYIDLSRDAVVIIKVYVDDARSGRLESTPLISNEFKLVSKVIMEDNDNGE